VRLSGSFDLSSLSDEEQRVLRLLARGATNKQIAECLGLSSGSVRGILAELLNHLGLADRTQAALVGYHAGLAAGDQPSCQRLTGT
jgi:DNA-binding NarL/FixJ family response regulator